MVLVNVVRLVVVFDNLGKNVGYARYPRGGSVCPMNSICPVLFIETRDNTDCNLIMRPWFVLVGVPLILD